MRRWSLEEIEREDKTRTEVLGARIALYITAKKWDMAAAVASHLVKVEPENEAWWINLEHLRRNGLLPPQGPGPRFLQWRRNGFSPAP